MPFITNPATNLKISKMKERVCWQHPLIKHHRINQTRLVLTDPETQFHPQAFNFLVIGDTGWGPHQDCFPQRQIAEQLLPYVPNNQFLLHMGDVVYIIGSREYYPKNFIQPYRELLQGGEQPEQIAYDRMVFKIPFLPVLGNHDYYDLPRWIGTLLQIGRPLVENVGVPLEDNIGYFGSEQGDTYARAFLDYLKSLNSRQLTQHLDQYYTIPTDTGRCLHYQPGHFTRLPNRYYQFQYGGVDFFALDSNTLIGYGVDSDPDQWQWLTQGLIHSWSQPHIRGRIVYCHHPAYVTEVTKWEQTESLLLRRCFRQIFNTVATAVGQHHLDNRSIVDLVLSGHAHCLEYIQTEDTGHADSYTHWVICGGSGCSVRPQYWGAKTLLERDLEGESSLRPVAESRLYVGLNGYGSDLHHPYSFLQIQISAGTPLRITLHPHVSEWYQGDWHLYDLAPIELKPLKRSVALS